MSSLRLRLLVPLGIGLTLLLAVGGRVVFTSVGVELQRRLDDALVDKARALWRHLELRVDPEHRLRVEALGAKAFGGAAGAPVDETARAELLQLAEAAFHVHLADTGRLDPDYAATDDAAYFEIRLGDGRELARSPSLGDGHLALDEPPGERQRHADLTLPDGRPGRAVVLRDGRVPFPDDARQRAWSGILGAEDIPSLTATLTVAQGTGEVDAFLRTLGRTLVGFLVVLVLGGGILALVLVLRGLAPLAELRRRIADLDPAALDQRVALRRAPAELVPVVDALNRRLDALEEAFSRERRTTAHIAHELRTPIAELRSLTEVALQFPDDTDLAAQSLRQGHEAAVHMSRVVEAVLRLARARATDEEEGRERLALAPLVASAWDGLRALATARDQTLASALPDDLAVVADPDALGALLANLLGNATRHAPPGSTIRVAGRRDGGAVVLEVVNPCTDLDADDLTHLDEPFWRKDAARSASEQGGLGLALAKAWARATGAELAFSLDEGAFTASLHFDP